MQRVAKILAALVFASGLVGADTALAGHGGHGGFGGFHGGWGGGLGWGYYPYYY